MSDHEFIWRFTPSRTHPRLLEEIFVQRHDLLNDIVEKAAESVNTGNRHHLLLVGPRGIGKTHLISLLDHRITQDTSLTPKVRIAWFLEDETVTSFAQLLKRIYELLAENHPDEFPLEWLQKLLGRPTEEIQRELETRLAAAFGDKTLLLLIENLDLIFEGLGTIGQKQWRSFLQEHPIACIVASTQRLSEPIKKRTEPFFGFFETIHLRPLGVKDSADLLSRIAVSRQQQDLVAFLNTPDGRSRVRALHHLAGGNHRIYVVLSGFITRESLDELSQPFEKMADELTPYYQERMRWLSPQQRQIVEYLCSQDSPVTPKHIAHNLMAAENTIGSQLKKLLEYGYVLRTPRGRESLYELAEPLMRLASEVKDKRRKPLRMLVAFLRVWYSPDQFPVMLRRAGSESLRSHLSAAMELSRSSPDPRLRLLQEEIERAKSEGRLEELLQVLEERAHIEPSTSNWLELGFYFAVMHRHTEAIIAYEKVLAIDAQDKFAWNNIGASLSAIGRYDAAIVCYDKALQIKPRDAAAWSNKGCALRHLGRYDTAIACYDKVLEIEPRDAIAWSSKGNSLNDLGRHDAAIECHNKSLEIAPQDASTWNNKGNSFYDLRDYRAAIECYDKALEIEPHDATAWNNKGNSFNDLADYKAAIECYDKALEIEPHDATAWSNKGCALHGLGCHDLAIESLEMSLKIDPSFGYAAFNKAECLFATARWVEGFQELRETFRAHPVDAKADHESIVHAIHTTSSGRDELLQKVKTLIEIYAEAKHLTRLGDGLVRSLKKINAEMLSEKALCLWRDIWLELGAPHADLELPLRIFRVGIQYLIQRDDRVLLDLNTTERRILQQALGLEDAASDEM
ncbi:MAG: tetratricopeptide repeat protein [Planctomycetota bacterium]